MEIIYGVNLIGQLVTVIYLVEIVQLRGLPSLLQPVNVSIRSLSPKCPLTWPSLHTLFRKCPCPSTHTGSLISSGSKAFRSKFPKLHRQSLYRHLKWYYRWEIVDSTVYHIQYESVSKWPLRRSDEIEFKGDRVKYSRFCPRLLNGNVFFLDFSNIATTVTCVISVKCGDDEITEVTKTG